MHDYHYAATGDLVKSFIIIHNAIMQIDYPGY
jgi:hypothetical protein